MSAIDYAGGELKIFAKAANWKAYFRARLERHLRGDVLEVGAGLGATTHVFASVKVNRWTCLEPDPRMAAQLRTGLAGSPRYEVITGTLEDLDPARSFDTIIYIDVLEHIEDDRAELVRAAARLRPGGALVVLSPAHQWLFTPFDQAIGHYRRYTASTLRALSPPGLRAIRVFYLDSVGLFASLANRLFLRQNMPTERQILTWDRAIVPLSRLVDPLLAFRFGKSVVGVWTKRSRNYAGPDAVGRFAGEASPRSAPSGGPWISEAPVQVFHWPRERVQRAAGRKDFTCPVSPAAGFRSRPGRLIAAI